MSKEAKQIHESKQGIPDGLGRILEASPVGLYNLQDERIIHANAWLAHALGYDTIEQLIGKNFLDMVHPEEKEKFGPGRREYNTVRPHSSLNYQPPEPEARLPLVPCPDVNRFTQVLP